MPPKKQKAVAKAGIKREAQGEVPAPKRVKGEKKPLDGLKLVRVGQRCPNPVVQMIEENGGEFLKSQQTLKRETTHLLDTGGETAVHSKWSNAIKGATERGLPIIILPADGGPNDIVVFLELRKKAERLAGSLHGVGLTRAELISEYKHEFNVPDLEQNANATHYRQERAEDYALREGAQGALSLKWTS